MILGRLIYLILDDFNRPPTGLNSNELLLINENQPIGSVAGNLVTTDLDADSLLIFNLIEGEEMLIMTFLH